MTLEEQFTYEWFRAVAVHPNSTQSYCRTDEIKRYWSTLAASYSKVIIGGDFNTSDPTELQVAPGFQINFSRSNHWGRFQHQNEHTAYFGPSPGVGRSLDHAFSNFGHYRDSPFQFGSVVGGHHNHPRADGGSGCDPRQILVDMFTGN